MFKISKKIIVPAVLFSVFASQKAMALFEFTNPLGAGTELDDMLGKVMGFLFGLAIVICPAFILWGAFLIATGAGEQEKTKQGRQIITYAVIGLVVIGLGNVIKAIIFDIVTTK